MRGSTGLGIPWTLLGSCRSPGQEKYTGDTGSGAWHPLTSSWVPFRGVPVPQIMPERGGGTACAVYIPQVQFLVKVDDARCCSTTGAGL